MLGLGVELRTSGRAASVLNHWTVLPALTLVFFSCDININFPKQGSLKMKCSCDSFSAQQFPVVISFSWPSIVILNDTRYWGWSCQKRGTCPCRTQQKCLEEHLCIGLSNPNLIPLLPAAPNEARARTVVYTEAGNGVVHSTYHSVALHVLLKLRVLLVHWSKYSMFLVTTQFNGVDGG